MLNIALELATGGNEVRVEAIVACSLDSWDPKNDCMIRRLYSERYVKVLRRIIVCEIFSYSQDIFSEHIRSTP